MIAGALISLVVALLIRAFWIRDLMILAAAVSGLAGAAKELIWDKWLRKGTPEWQDAYATVWGGLFIAILMYFIP